MVETRAPADPTRRRTGTQDSGAANAPLALTTGHISPRGVLRLSVGGSVAQLRGVKGPEPDCKRAKRSRIWEYSRKSRSRLQCRLGAIDRRAIDASADVLFATLTYPGDFNPDPERWKRDLDAFCKRLERKYQNAATIWRLEAQKRGAPHYHLLIFNVSYIDKDWVAQAWYEVVGSGDERHLRRGTRIEKLRSWKGVTAYAAKYLAKADEGRDPFVAPRVGRHWGVRRAHLLPTQWFEVEVEAPQWYQLRRVLKGLKSASLRQRTGERGNWRYMRSYAGGWCFVSEDTQAKLLWIANQLC